VPIAATLIAQGFAFAFVLISAALATVNTELWEAAEMTGASRRHILRDIILPIVFPAVVSSGLLAFAESVSNFAAPALLGLPVRFHTISTRLYGSISTGQVERGYVLAILLIVIAAALLWVSTRVTSGRRSFATITGKGGHRTILRLGALRWPLCVTAVVFLIMTTVLPLLALLVSSFARRTNALNGGLTSHFWLGASDPAFAQGQEGVLRNPQVVDAALNTLILGVLAALAATALGLAIGYVIARSRMPRLSGAVGMISYLPFLIPGVAFGAVYIAQFGTPMGPIPALYGTFLLLVLASAIYNLPFAAQAGRTAVGQISGELEEAAIMAGASFPRRLIDIFVPLASRGLIAGALLVFVNTVRELALVVLLAPLTLPLLSIITFRYAADGFAQFANAITVIIVLICVVATLAARRLQGAAQPWSER
jgi:iron(III) transport system permease protein